MPTTEGLSAGEFAKELTRNVRYKMLNTPVPCGGGGLREWTSAVYTTLEAMAEDRNKKCYHWLVDRIWWSDEGLDLVAECEWERSPAKLLQDFDKLPSFKAPLKALIFSATPDCVEQTLKEFQKYLSNFRQHVAHEETYVVVVFGNEKDTAYKFTPIVSGRQEHGAVFEPIRL